jgi:hypothetical protein
VRKDVVTFNDVIADVRRQLSDKGIRIAQVPTPFKLAWWPSNSTATEQYVEQLHSDYGQPLGPKKLNEEFAAEVNAIHECLNTHQHDPGLAKWQRLERDDEEAEAATQMYKSLNQRATAISLWEQIAFPLRRQGDILFRIRAPRDISGSPIIDPMLVDDFIRGVSAHTVGDKQEIARLRKRLNLWKLIAAGATAVAALVLSIAVFA